MNKNLTLIGTSHIAKESLKEVENIISNIKPDIVAVELDRRRLHSLFQKNQEKVRMRDISRVGFKGFLFSLFGGWAEKKLGQVVGVSPGSEMKKAIQIARKNKMKIALIDQDIEITLKKFSRALTWKEKGRFVLDIFEALFKKRKIEFDLATVPDEKLIETMLEEVKMKYPNVYKVLIQERNEIMAYSLQQLLEKHPDKKIVAIVGAGHKKGMQEILNRPNISYSFSFSQ